MTYYIYENWTAENKSVIHHGDCGNCKNGQGCHKNTLGERNGRWLGPFHTIEEAYKAATDTKRPVRKHSCAQ